ncbi:Protein of unknown function [Lachnospiraceae bacterium G41]|jgi:hypothetical protein|nr:Protein of unknown function [Lachnospiraceae bacterium G41]
MQEELERKTVALAFNAGKFTIEELLNAMKKAVDSGIKHIPKSKEPKGEMTLKELIGKGNKAEKIEIAEDSLKSFQRTANKYNVDYAIHKVPENGVYKYYVFFQAKDYASIDSAFKEYVYKNDKKKESLKQKINKNKEKVKQRKDKEKSKERDFNRERSR